MDGMLWGAKAWLKWVARSTLSRPLNRRRWEMPIPPAFDQHRVIFIHIPKTAGTALIKHLGWDMPSHVDWRYHMMAYPHKFATYWSFSFVRDPWDRVVSAYHFLSQGGMTDLDAAWASQHLRQYGTFEDFVLCGLGKPEIQAQYHFRPQAAFVCDRRGRIRVDWVGRYEALEEGLRVVSARLGRPIVLPKVNASTHREYRSLYSPEMADAVGQVYATDCGIFGYAWQD